MPNPPFLNDFQVAEQQAIVDGYLNGAAPVLNPANVNTQTQLGNTFINPAILPLTPNYPLTTFTPNLNLILKGQDPSMQQNLLILDNAAFTTNKTIITITAAQLATIHTTPIQVIAAPGVGFYIQVQHCTLKYIFGTVPYGSFGSPGAWTMTYEPSALSTAASISASTFIQGSSNGLGFMTQTGINTAAYTTAIDNSGVYLTCTANPASLGDGTLVVELWYYLDQFLFNPVLLEG